VQALQEDNIPSFTGKRWASCSVGFILTDRKALGYYQPHKLVDGRRQPDGEPIQLYPACVTESDYLKARAGMEKRRKALGEPLRHWTAEEDAVVREKSVGQAARLVNRSRAAVYQRRKTLGLTTSQRRSEGGNFVNLFTGILFNARPPYDTFIVATRMDCNGLTKVLMNSAHAAGAAKCSLFPLRTFERAVLVELSELDPKDVLPPAGDDAHNELSELQAELAGIDAELEKASALMDKLGLSETIAKRIITLEAKRKELQPKLDEAKARAATPAQEVWRDFGSLVEAMDNANDPKDARLRLKTALRRIVERIDLLIVPKGADRLAMVQMEFRGGGRRDYLIWHRPARFNGKGSRVEGWWRVPSCRADEMERIGFTQPDIRDGYPEGWADYLRDFSQEELDKLLFYECEPHPLH
jgi:hypothetical protein